MIKFPPAGCERLQGYSSGLKSGTGFDNDEFDGGAALLSSLMSHHLIFIALRDTSRILFDINSLGMSDLLARLGEQSLDSLSEISAQESHGVLRKIIHPHYEFNGHHTTLHFSGQF